MISLGAFQKANDLRETLDSLCARNEAAVYADYQGGDPHPARTCRDNAVVSRNIFASHSRVRVGSIPVVVEGSFLQHRQQFIVGELARRSAGRRRKIRKLVCLA